MYGQLCLYMKMGIWYSLNVCMQSTFYLWFAVKSCKTFLKTYWHTRPSLLCIGFFCAVLIVGSAEERVQGPIYMGFGTETTLSGPSKATLSSVYMKQNCPPWIFVSQCLVILPPLVFVVIWSLWASFIPCGFVIPWVVPGRPVIHVGIGYTVDFLFLLSH